MTLRCPFCNSPLKEGTVPIEALPGLDVSPQRRRILDALVQSHPRFLTISQLADAVYADDPDGGPEGAFNVTRTQISKLRRVLPPYGWQIPATRPGRNTMKLYRLEPAR